MIRQTSDPLIAQLIQLELTAQGFYKGAIDGSYGPMSEAAFQAYRGFNRYASISRLTISLSADQQADMAKFLKIWKNPVAQALYVKVSAAANVPPELIAAIHYRECGGNFNCYLHNGDPLGEPTVHVPRGLLFTSWSTAAIDALVREPGAYAASEMAAGCRNVSAMCVFAEHYNGLGYMDHIPPSADPYVLAGTSGYVAGKYVADDVFDPAAVDGQLGVYPMLKAIINS